VHEKNAFVIEGSIASKQGSGVKSYGERKTYHFFELINPLWFLNLVVCLTVVIE
jgi:hypothetical protein